MTNPPAAGGAYRSSPPRMARRRHAGWRPTDRGVTRPCRAACGARSSRVMGTCGVAGAMALRTTLDPGASAAPSGRGCGQAKGPALGAARDRRAQEQAENGKEKINDKNWGLTGPAPSGMTRASSTPIFRRQPARRGDARTPNLRTKDRPERDGVPAAGHADHGVVCGGLGASRP